MKALIKSIKLIQVGFLLGTFFWMWIMSEEEQKKKPRQTSDEFEKLYNHYKKKEAANA